LEKSLDTDIQYWAAWQLTEAGNTGIDILKKIKNDKTNQGREIADAVLTERNIK